MKTNDATNGDSPVWWRLPIVWMVLGGPAAVVVAGLATYWVAVSHPDPVVADKGRSAVSTDVAAGPSKPGRVAADIPAQQARNHAATGR